MEKKHAPVTKAPYLVLLFCILAIALISYFIMTQFAVEKCECAPPERKLHSCVGAKA